MYMKKKLTMMMLVVLMSFSAGAQQVMTAQNMVRHSWQGKRVAYFGDSITDPRNKAANKK
jgi:hypothetical protein